MSDLTLYPADIAAMSVSQIAHLTPYSISNSLVKLKVQQ